MNPCIEKINEFLPIIAHRYKMFRATNSDEGVELAVFADSPIEFANKLYKHFNMDRRAEYSVNDKFLIVNDETGGKRKYYCIMDWVDDELWDKDQCFVYVDNLRVL